MRSVRPAPPTRRDAWRDAERGNIEYLALGALVVALLAAIALRTDVGQRMGDAFAAAVCDLLPGDVACGSGGDGGSDPGGPDVPDDDLAAPADPDDLCALGPPPGTVPGPDGRPQVPLDPRSHAAGAGDAGGLGGLLDGVPGLGSPYGFEFDMGSSNFNIIPVDYDAAVAAYPGLVDFLASHGDRLTDPSYAAGLVNELGPDRVRTLIDLANTYGLANLVADDLDGPYRDYVQPLAKLLGAADRSGHLDPAIRRVLTDPRPPTTREILDSIADPDLLDSFDPDYPDNEVHAELTLHLELQRQRAYGLLLHEADLSPRTRAELAARILAGPQPFKLDAIGLVDGFGDPSFAGPNELADARWTALQALADDPAAAALFFRDPANAHLVEAWLGEDAYDHADVFLLNLDGRTADDLDRDDLAALMRQAAQHALDADCT